MTQACIDAPAEIAIRFYDHRAVPVAVAGEYLGAVAALRNIERAPVDHPGVAIEQRHIRGRNDRQIDVKDCDVAGRRVGRAVVNQHIVTVRLPSLGQRVREVGLPEVFLHQVFEDNDGGHRALAGRNGDGAS